MKKNGIIIKTSFCYSDDGVYTHCTSEWESIFVWICHSPLYNRAQRRTDSVERILHAHHDCSECRWVLLLSEPLCSMLVCNRNHFLFRSMNRAMQTEQPLPHSCIPLQLIHRIPHTYCPKCFGIWYKHARCNRKPNHVHCTNYSILLCAFCFR